MIQKGCEVGRARLEQLNTIKAVTLAVCLKNSQYNSLPLILTYKSLEIVFGLSVKL